MRSNSQRCSANANATITPAWTAKSTCGSVLLSAIAPAKYTMSVWISTNNESNPMICGVRMRLFVTVWNSTLE